MPLPSYVQDAVKEQEEKKSRLPDYVQAAVQVEQELQQTMQPSVQPTVPPPPRDRTVLGAAKEIIAPLPTRGPGEKEFWTENIPRSISRLPVTAAVGTGQLLYGAAKEFTDPISSMLESGVSGEQLKELFNAPRDAGSFIINSLAEATAAPFGLGKETTFKEAWSDPAAAVLAVSPFGKPVAKVGKRIAKARPTGEGFMENALGFSSTVKPSKRKQVIKTIQNERALPTEASYAKFDQKIWSLMDEVDAKIGDKAGNPIDLKVDSWAAGAKKRLASTAKKGANIKAANRYIEQFKKDYPEMTLLEANKVRRDINKELDSMYRRQERGGTVTSKGQVEAMKSIERGLRDAIEAQVPGVKRLNTRVHNMIVAEPFLRKAMNKAKDTATVNYRDIAFGGVGGYALGAEATMPLMIASRVMRDPRTQAIVGRSIHDVNTFASKAAGLFKRKPQETAKLDKIVEEVEGQLALPPGENQLALPAPPDVIQLGDTPTRPIPMGAPKERFKSPNSWERMFQIAQSPEGKRLLVERLSREEKYSKLVQEMIKIPEQPLLPPGQGFAIRGKPGTPQDLQITKQLARKNALAEAYK